MKAIPDGSELSPAERIDLALTTLQAIDQRVGMGSGSDPALSEDLASAIDDLRSVAEEIRRGASDLTVARHHYDSESGRYVKLFDLAPGGYLETDLQSVIKLANVASSAILGADQGELIGEPLGRFIAEESQEHFNVRLASLREGGEATSWEVRLQPSTGAPVDVAVAVSRGRDGWEGPEQRRVLRWLLFDVTERREREEQLAYLAYHDELTGLPNRRMLGEFLRVALARAKRDRTGVAVVCIDIDDFKAINDNLGHVVGDRVLQLFGNRLNRATRESDVVCRFGGDEFMLLLSDVPVTGGTDLPEEVEQAARRIQQVAKEPYVINGIEVHTSVSVGISISPRDAENARALLARADSEMYRTKALNRRRALIAVDFPRRTELGRDEVTVGGEVLSHPAGGPGSSG